MATALFGSANHNRNQSKNLVEFRAGKMFMKGKMVHPDTRKGLVYVHQSEDELMHFCWKDRQTGVVEDDLIIFPDDTEFKHVPQCTTGRVYVLKFKSSSRRFFIWMQDPKSDKDDEHRKKVNDFLNNPPARVPGAGLADLGGNANEFDIQNLLGNMTQQQLMQLMGGMGVGDMRALSSLIGSRPGSTQSTGSEPVARTTSSSAPSRSTELPSRPATSVTLPTSVTPTPHDTPAPGVSARQQIQLSDLSNILHNITPPIAANGGAAGGPNLAEALRTEAIIPILSNHDVQERLLPLLPEGESLPRTEAELRATMHSPHFRQALNTFGIALQSGDLGPLMGQFGLGDDVVAAASRGDLEAFVRALQGQTKDAEMKDESGDKTQSDDK